jgi:hypothetical protein
MGIPGAPCSRRATDPQIQEGERADAEHARLTND